MLEQLLPRTIDNTYRGQKAALWLLGLLLLMKTAMGLNSIINGYKVATSADGIPLDTYPPAAARTIVALFGIWGLGQAMFTKVIVVLDDDTDVHDLAEVAWKALNHIDPERDLELVMGPVETLDHASRLPCYGSKVGVDATRKSCSTRAKASCIAN